MRLPTSLLQLEAHARAWLFRILAIVVILVGMVLFPLPIPLGLIFIFAGIGMLVSSSSTVAGWVRRFREKNRPLDVRLRAVGRKAPNFIKRTLRRTQPKPPKRGPDDAPPPDTTSPPDQS